MIFMQSSNTMWFGLSDSFWGALLGALITGLIAIAVFWWGSSNEVNKRKKLVKNYSKIILELDKIASDDFKMFISAGKNEIDLADKYNAKLVELNVQGKILNKIDVNSLIKESDKALYILKYITAYEESVELLFKTHNKYGNIFLGKEEEDNNRSQLGWLEFYFEEMENSIGEIK